MCSNHRPSAPRTWGEGLRNFFSNWDQPLPFHVKLGMATRNFWLRLQRGANCCGNDGQPGC